MKKPLKPFAVELRRTGKKLASLPAKHILEKTEAEPASDEQPTLSAWPEPEGAYVSEARRAADALFARSTQAPIQAKDTSEPAREAADARRVLPSLDEPDYIARLLQEEEANRPRRGRKPGAGLAPVRRIVVKPQEATPEPVAMRALLEALPKKIKGYVRGRIYARYVRRTEAAPGQYWRKRPKPAW